MSEIIVNGKNVSILDMVDKIERMRRSSVYDNGRIRIMNSEMSIINAIGESTDLHVTALAAKLDISKGAVSQTLAKLTEKKLVKKIKDEQNASRLFIVLTDLGKEIYYKHKRYHEELDQMAEKLLDDASDETIAFLAMFIEKITDKLNQEYDMLGDYLETVNE